MKEHDVKYSKKKRVSPNSKLIIMKKTFYVFFFLSFANGLLGQVGLQAEGTQYEKKSQLNWEKRNDPLKVLFTKNITPQFPVDLKKYFLAENAEINSSNIFAKKNASLELAFFCKIEVQLENASNLPVRFRLGEVQAVDKKEGKWQQFNN